MGLPPHMVHPHMAVHALFASPSIHPTQSYASQELPSMGSVQPAAPPLYSLPLQYVVQAPPGQLRAHPSWSVPVQPPAAATVSQCPDPQRQQQEGTRGSAALLPGAQRGDQRDVPSGQFSRALALAPHFGSWISGLGSRNAGVVPYTPSAS